MPDRSKIVLELDLEESLENPDQTVLVLQDAKRDYVLETEKDTPAEILALLGVALIAAGMSQLDAFALKVNGFCMNEDLIVDLSETGFLQLFLGKDRKEKQRLKADLLKSRTREIEDGLLPLYEKEKTRVLKKDSTVTQENAGKISEALFNRKGAKEILQTLAELEREIEEVSRKTAYNDFLNGGRLHSWNILFADYMQQVMNGNEEAEKKLCLLFDPKLDVLADEVRKEMHQVQPEDTNVAALKTKLQFLRFIRMDSAMNAPIQQAFAEDTINSMDGSFLDEHDLTEQKRIFFLFLQELISQTLEYGDTPLQEHNIHSIALVMLSSLPEERDEAIWQIMTALSCAAVLYPQGPYGIQLAPELMLEGPAKSMSWFLAVCEDDPQFILDHVELAALSLCAILQYVSLSPDLVERAISAADGLFLAMSTSARLKKPLDPVTLLALERLIRQILTMLDRQENELNEVRIFFGRSE